MTDRPRPLDACTARGMKGRSLRPSAHHMCITHLAAGAFALPCNSTERRSPVGRPGDAGGDAENFGRGEASWAGKGGSGVRPREVLGCSVPGGMATSAGGLPREAVLSPRPPRGRPCSIRISPRSSRAWTGGRRSLRSKPRARGRKSSAASTGRSQSPALRPIFRPGLFAAGRTCVGFVGSVG